MPERIQLSRKKGWRKPEGTIIVARPTWMGNPFGIYEHCKGRGGDWGVRDLGRFHAPMGHGWTRKGAAEVAVEYYREELEKAYPLGGTARFILVQSLRGHNLACWCPLGQPCHADVLLELANETEPSDVLG